MTNLQEILQKDLLISFANLTKETELIQDIQEKLGRIGFVNLAAVSLGHLDPETSEALVMFQEVARCSVVDAIDSSFAIKLMDITKNADWPIALNQDGMVGLTQYAVNEVRNRKLANENTRPKMTREPEIGRDASKAISLSCAVIRKDWEVLGCSEPHQQQNKINKACAEPVRPIFSSSEFLAWARH